MAVIAIPRISNTTKATKDRACRTNVDLMNRQIELYHTITGSWPQQLTDVTEDSDYFPDGPPECPFDWEYRMGNDNYRVIEHGDHSVEAQSDGGDDDDDSQGGQDRSGGRGRGRRGR